MLASRHILGSFKLQTTRKLFLPYVGQKRFLSTTNDDEKNFYEKHRKTIINATMVSGAALTFYGLGSFMWDVTFSLLNMSPAAHAYYGFLGGVSGTVVVLGTAYYNKIRIHSYPEAVFKKSLNVLNNNDEFKSILGGYASASGLKAYTQTSGYWTFENFRPKWTHPRLNMIYLVSKGGNEAVVTVDAIQDGRHSKILFMGADLLNASKSRVLIQGDLTGFIKHEALVSNVSFKAAVVQ